jgi:P27 family predicted phage terminase small subunit
MPGRHPKSIQAIEADNSQIHLTKAEMEARCINTPGVITRRLYPPKWLNDAGRQEWKRIVRLARRAGIFNGLDVNALGMYCQSYGRAVEAYDEYRKLKRLMGADKNVLVMSSGKINPLIRLMQQEEEQCRKWSAVLGLDPVGRARIGLAKAKHADDDDPMAAFLNNIERDLNYESSGY